MKSIIVALIVMMSLGACANKIKSPDASKSSYWFVNKKLVNDRAVSPRPEEGGPDFMIFDTTDVVGFKVGDIVNRMKWTVKGDSLYLRDELLGRSMQFKLGSNDLIDQYGTKWYVKP